MDFTASVRLMTYNHEGFIAKAIEGVLMQKTSFKVQLVIGDDFSTDKTLEIAKSYSSTSNVEIVILDRPVGGEYYHKRQELGRLYNFMNILEHCQGEYIALLDGDDYWIDETKLQKQVDFMRDNSNCSLSFTACKIDKLDGRVNVVDIGDKPKLIDHEEFFEKLYFISTPSIVVRKDVLELFNQDWVLNSFAGDFIMKYCALIKGVFGYLPIVSCVYNQGVAGSWTRSKKTLQIILKEFRDSLRALYFLRKNNGISQSNFEKKIMLERQAAYYKFALTLPKSKGFFYLARNVHNTSAHLFMSYCKNLIR